jgi:hypothetical protein
MKKILFHISLVLLLTTQVNAQVLPNLGGQRAGLSAHTFLKNDINPRSAAMGGSSIAIGGDGYSAFTNPAGMLAENRLNFSTANLMVGAGINQSFLSAIIPQGENAAFGFSLNSLTTGAMEVRTEFQPEGTGQYFYAGNLAVGASHARKLSDMFTLGVSLKYLYEQIAEYSNHAAAVDLAFLYKTDFKDLSFAVMVSNFGGSASMKGNDLPVNFNRDTSDFSLENYTIPTVFSMGISIIPYKDEQQSILTSIQLNHPNDNAENIRFGIEYEYKKLFFVRGGYKLSVMGQNFPTFGFGVRSRIGAHPLLINYAANPTNFMGMQHLLGLSFSINKDKRE